MELIGCVVKKLYAAGTKSEREAVMLETAEGVYVLRRVGGNAFQDPTLNLLVGSRICAKGDLHASTFMMTDWHAIKSSPS